VHSSRRRIALQISSPVLVLIRRIPEQVHVILLLAVLLQHQVADEAVAHELVAAPLKPPVPAERPRRVQPEAVVVAAAFEEVEQRDGLAQRLHGQQVEEGGVPEGGRGGVGELGALVSGLWLSEACQRCPVGEGVAAVGDLLEAGRALVYGHFEVDYGADHVVVEQQ